MACHWLGWQEELSSITLLVGMVRGGVDEIITTGSGGFDMELI
jgi:hypothetical protein